MFIVILNHLNPITPTCVDSIADHEAARALTVNAFGLRLIENELS